MTSLVTQMAETVLVTPMHTFPAPTSDGIMVKRSRARDAT
jgi:hypothetical protein